MSERASVFEGIFIGAEPTSNPGAPRAAGVVLGAISIMPKPVVETRRFRPVGRKFDKLVIPGKDYTEASYEGVAAYNDNSYVFDSVMGVAEVSTPSGATDARERINTMTPDGPDTVQTYTVETGSSVRAARFNHGVFTSLTLAFNRDEVTISGDMIGQDYQDGINRSVGSSEHQRLTIAATGGTFTSTIPFGASGTTGALAWDITPEALETALNGLSNVPDGEIVVEAGTTSLIYEIYYLGSMAGDTAAMTTSATNLTGTSPTAAVTVVTAGAATRYLESVPVTPDSVDVFIDTLFTDIGESQLERAISAELSISDRFVPLWVLNSSNASWVALIETAPEVALSMVLEADATGMTYLSTLRNGETRFIRIRARDAVDSIETGQRYSLTIDGAFKVEAIDDLADSDGVFAVTYTWRLVEDDDLDSLTVTTVNTVASL